MNDIDTLLASLGIQPEEDAGMNKQASAATDLQGQAETSLTEDKPSMTKKAYEYGRELASAIIQEAGRLEKQANLMTDQNARIVAEQMQQVYPVPDGDIDEITKGLIARARGAGAQDMDPDLESWLGQAAEGNSGGHIPDELRLQLLGSDEPDEDGVGKLIGTDQDEREIEKASSLIALIESGVDYDTAAHLIKTAAEQIDGYSDMEKAAAAIELMDSEGLSFEDAIELVKAAAEKGEKREIMERNMDRAERERKSLHGRVSSARESLGERAHGIREAVKEKGKAGLDELREKVDALKESAGERARGVRKAVGDHVVRNRDAYHVAAGGAAALGGMALGHAGNKIKDAVVDRFGRDKSVAGRAKRGLKGLEKAIRKNPKLAAGIGAGALVAGGAGAAMHEHHKKAELLADLVDSGYSLAEASSLIKQASQADQGYSEIEKAAAVLDLMNAGVDMEVAVASVERVTG